VDHGDGTYTYTFAKDLGAYDAAITYDPTLRHRFAIQSSGGEWAYVNLVYDFVPNQLPGPNFTFPDSRDIVTTAACNECHGTLTLHGSRIETKYCVVCHNPTLDGGNGHFTKMVHGIHAAGIRSTPYSIGSASFGEVTYPQDLKNCRKCHKGTDSDNWKTKPSMQACSACHDDVDFSGAGTHIAQATNQLCNLCHTPDYIENKHLTDNATPNNPNVPVGAANFTYEISGVTADGNNSPVVVFRILKDGVPATFVTYAPGGTTLLTGFTGSPSFMVAYALAQDPHDSPIDYNNRGNTAGQPVTVSIQNCWNGTQGTLTGPDGSGFYTATLNGSGNAGRWPVGATLRAVALQGYFTQVSPALARHTISVMKACTGDTARRAVVDSANCAKCHEWFEGHGGNRVYQVQVCVMCHVPNLSTSGRGSDPANLALPASTADDMFGLDPLLYPEDTNNFKDMIHGIHASEPRTVPFEFVRDRGTSGIYGYDWSEVTFPGILNNCTTCHLAGTYEIDGMADQALLPSNVRTTSGDPAEIRATILAYRASVPNATDLVNSPVGSSCFYCHTSAAAQAHMEFNGASFGWERGDFETSAPYESCEVCHGPGKVADVEVVHMGE
jgi:OmcA/MtrC family decaheme c-type cytochrome